MTSHYWRMRTYPPYFDSRTSWFPNSWAYRDAQAIYNPSALASRHPEWILRDAAGRKLFLQFGCARGTCPEYAADVGNPAFRAWWIADAVKEQAAGYRGVFIDDVNMALPTGDGEERFVAPVDPRTGRAMTQAAWQRYTADFMVEVRRALPGAEIVHNALWTLGDASPEIRRELAAADYIEIERGFNDPNITGAGFETLARFIDRRHAAGQGVILDADAPTPAGRMYGLATYFLVGDGRDALANDAWSRPDHYWTGYDVSLGNPRGPRYRRDGVWRRDFEHGFVLVDEPGAPVRRVDVGPGLRLAGGGPVTSVTLRPGSGAVLVRA
jgi:hypothetical protein